MTKTAIMLFSLSPSSEAHVKSFIGTQDHSPTNLKLAQVFYDTTLIKVKSTGIPYLLVDESKQTGTSFSERFLNGLEYVFDHGYDNVIAIGNDCPNLSSDGLRAVRDDLLQHDLVLGPSTDGGIYLMGISKEIYDRQLLESCSWQSSILYNELLKLSHCLGHECHILNKEMDIDSSRDLRVYLSQLRNRSNSIWRRLNAILMRTDPVIHKIGSILLSFQAADSFALRAPPHA